MAAANGKFGAEIAPIEVLEKRKTVLMDRDEGPRPETTMETLAGLRPSFDKNGVITAGNASQISDGAAALLLASEEAVERYKLQPIARILGKAQAGVEPCIASSPATPYTPPSTRQPSHSAVDTVSPAMS